MIQNRSVKMATRTLSTLSTKPLSAMKPGTPIAGLDFLKNVEPPVSKARSEYPEWIDDLAKPMATLAKLRKMNTEEAEDKDMMRYLKLMRRKHIKEKNIDAGLR